jgi:hypothetical protein
MPRKRNRTGCVGKSWVCVPVACQIRICQGDRTVRHVAGFRGSTIDGTLHNQEFS